MDDNVKIIMAYAIIAIGPIIGSYAVVKNSSKLTSSMFGAFNKVGSRLSKAAGKFAEKRYKRSAFGTYMSDRERSRDTWAKIRGREKIQKFGEKDTTYERGLFKGRRTATSRLGMAGLKTARMDDREARSFKAQLTGQSNAVYRDEVEAFKQDLGNKYSDKTHAQDYYWERMRSGDVDAAEAHALHDHMLSFSGGASWMDKVWTGEVVDTDGGGHNIGHYVKQNALSGGDAYTGIQRSLLADSSKFKGGSADASYAMGNFAKGYLNELANSDGQTKVGSGRAVDKFLEENWTQFEYERDAQGNVLRDPTKNNEPIIKVDANGQPIKKTVTFTDIDGVTQTKVLVDTDPNGGLDYTDDRAKNIMGMGSRMAKVQGKFGMTHSTARTIYADPGKSQIEHIVAEMAEEHVNKFGGTTPPPTTPPAPPTTP